MKIQTETKVESGKDKKQIDTSEDDDMPPLFTPRTPQLTASSLEDDDMPPLFTPHTPHPTASSLSDSECDSEYSLSSCADDYHTDEEFNKMSEEEINDIKYLSIFDTHQDFDKEIMTTNAVAALKNMESTMIERTKKGYYMCTTLHRELYNKMLIAYSKYCTPTMLGMLQHEFLTQKNEAMNHSVATLAPKTKTFSKLSSLLTRVLLCGATQIVGHHEVWNRIKKIQLYLGWQSVSPFSKKRRGQVKKATVTKNERIQGREE